ncbi:MAG: DNA translocase FtsK, partial [Thermoguttaceae bacterium]|nr:DNA translocase FtsK [Thermoguttaceae bacterium]
MIRTELGQWTSPLGCSTALFGALLAGLILASEPAGRRSKKISAAAAGEAKKPAARAQEFPAKAVKTRGAPAGEEALAEDEEILFAEKPSRGKRKAKPVPEDTQPQLPLEDPYRLPSINLLEHAQERDLDQMREQIIETGRQVEKAFADYDIRVKVVEMQSGPILTLYEIALPKGTRLSQIRTLHQDLAIRLKVPSVRIVAPIPGKNTVGVEVPHHQRQMVYLSEVMEEAGSQADEMAIPLFLGKDVSGDPMVADLAKLPHLLIAGRTGTGKSVCLNAIILSILMTRTPDEVRLLLIDPKVVEFTLYQSIPHLYYPVVTDMKKAEAILEWAVNKMEERYKILARAGVRQLSEYNSYTPEELRMRMRPASEEEWAKIPKKLASIVIIADEIGDLMAVAGKDVQGHIIRLAQKSRAVGIHLILATQKPTVDVITGLIKSNLPARIAFGVTNVTDSRVVLDERGAEQLLGNGDMLFLLPGTSRLIRGQGTYVSNREVETIVREVSDRQQDFEAELFSVGGGEEEQEHPDRTAELLRRKDSLYNEAVEFLIQEGRGSTSILQRRFNIGYSRAARIIDTMAAEGIVGPYKGSQARDVIVTFDQWLAIKEGGAPPAAAAADQRPAMPWQQPSPDSAAAPRPQKPAAESKGRGISLAGGIRQV